MTFSTKTEMLLDLQHWVRLHKKTKNLSQDLAAVLRRNSPEHNDVWMLFEAYTKTLARSFGDKIQNPNGWPDECLLEQMVADGKTLYPVAYVDAVIAARGQSLISPRGSEGEKVTE